MVFFVFRSIKCLDPSHHEVVLKTVLCPLHQDILITPIPGPKVFHPGQENHVFFTDAVWQCRDDVWCLLLLGGLFDYAVLRLSPGAVVSRPQGVVVEHSFYRRLAANRSKARVKICSYRKVIICYITYFWPGVVFVSRHCGTPRRGPSWGGTSEPGSLRPEHSATSSVPAKCINESISGNLRLLANIVKTRQIGNCNSLLSKCTKVEMQFLPSTLTRARSSIQKSVSWLSGCTWDQSMSNPSSAASARRVFRPLLLLGMMIFSVVKHTGWICGWGGAACNNRCFPHFSRSRPISAKSKGVTC